MHFHLPKPLHGWRELAGEVGIIVVGVLIALGFEQVAESIHDRRLADETRASIKQELQTGLASLSFRRDASREGSPKLEHTTMMTAATKLRPE